MTQIIHVAVEASDFGLIFAEPLGNKLDVKTIKSIHARWITSTIVDERGIMWISTLNLHQLLRTDPNTATFHVDNTLREQDKRQYGQQIYVRGNVINGLIDNILQSARSIKREEYLRYSESIYREIRDCHALGYKRAGHYELLKSRVPGMKSSRIKTLQITRDELTGESYEDSPRQRKIWLDKMQFSHIRSIAAFPEIADRIWNGVITDINNHRIITDRGICHEDDLIELCYEYGWNTDWYSIYLDNFNSNEYPL